MRTIAAWTGALVYAAALTTSATATTMQPAGTPASCYLILEVGPLFERPTGHFHLTLVFRNRGPVTCRLAGWPYAKFYGPQDPTFGSIYVVPEQPGRRPVFTLPVGSRAHAVLSWLKPTGGHKWVPNILGLYVTSLGTRRVPLAIKWPYGAVLRQDAAPNAGTYIGPLRRGAG